MENNKNEIAEAILELAHAVDRLGLNGADTRKGAMEVMTEALQDIAKSNRDNAKLREFGEY